jgi:iron complex transport system ATP-binding protein
VTPALRLSDVSVVSSSGLRQLDTVSLDLNMGDLLGIIGPNGAGKTTLLRTALALVPHASGRIEWQGRVLETLRTRELARIAAYVPQSQPVDQLSGGERARVLRARALAVDAPVLLADEPVAALDAYHQLAMLQRLRELARGGRAVTIILHDLTLAARFCTRIAMLVRGRVVVAGSPEDTLSQTNLQSVYGVEALLGTHEGERFALPWRMHRQQR